ncbi:MAG: VOC family protein [Acidimicrobiia bacterium]|nr:VOC family protein [Acidimicrobiia bacterium]
MLLDGVDHIAILTKDAKRLCDWYGEIFDAEVEGVTSPPHGEGVSLTFLRLGPHTEFNVFQIEGNEEAARQTPMFGRGRIDHFGLRASSLENFEVLRERLMACGATDGFVTDFGPVLSVFFRDPEGLEGEVLVPNPDAKPGVTNPPGTPAARYS